MAVRPVISTWYLSFIDNLVANNTAAPALPSGTGATAPNPTVPATAAADQILLQENGGTVGGTYVPPNPVDVWLFQNLRHPLAVGVFQTKLTAKFPHQYIPRVQIGSVNGEAYYVYFGVAIFSKWPLSFTQDNYSSNILGWNAAPIAFARFSFAPSGQATTYGAFSADCFSGTVQPPTSTWIPTGGSIFPAVSSWITLNISAQSSLQYFCGIMTGSNKWVPTQYATTSTLGTLSDTTASFTQNNYPALVLPPNNTTMNDGYILRTNTYFFSGVPKSNVNNSLVYTTSTPVGRLPTIWK